LAARKTGLGFLSFSLVFDDCPELMMLLLETNGGKMKREK